MEEATHNDMEPVAHNGSEEAAVNDTDKLLLGFFSEVHNSATTLFGLSVCSAELAFKAISSPCWT